MSAKVDLTSTHTRPDLKVAYRPSGAFIIKDGKLTPDLNDKVMKAKQPSAVSSQQSEKKKEIHPSDSKKNVISSEDEKNVISSGVEKNVISSEDEKQKVFS